MCGEVSGDRGYGDTDWTPFQEETVRARKAHRCCVCYGDIPPGAYYARMGYVQDGAVSSMRFHLQCRDLCREAEWYEDGLLVELSDHPDRGPDWAAHRRAVAVWAAGGEYQREAPR